MKPILISIALAALLAAAWLIYVGETAEPAPTPAEIAEWASPATLANNNPTLEITP